MALYPVLGHMSFVVPLFSWELGQGNRSITLPDQLCFIHTKYIFFKFAPDCPIGLALDRWKQWVLHPIFCSPIGQSRANCVV